MVGIIQRIFGSQKNESGEVPTVPISQDDEYDHPIAYETSEELSQFIVGCAQSVGKQRNHNEDALLTLTSNLANDRDQVPLGLYVVADGMGGHKEGELASELAVRTMGTLIMRKVFLSLLAPQPSAPTESIQEIMRSGTEDAHRAILKEAPGSGTTLTAVLILGEQMTISHVGDSRVYSISTEGKVDVLTRDHSLVMRMIELDQLTAEEAAVHPQRNVLYRALGQGEPFEPDISTVHLPESGFLMLCSDGLWGVVPEDELVRLVLETPSPQQACNLLVEAANEAGGPDNITVVLIRLPK